MLILIVVVIAVVAIAASQLMKTAENTAGRVDVQSDKLLNKTEMALKGKEGSICAVNDDCLSDNCNSNYRCE
ncbi:MAG: hypothetical protein Q7S22_01505 [Candidatus Micrarchaeota archaeon]|nr:hypothetical protein [Candidatus Micrarchaeota archaeon]